MGDRIPRLEVHVSNIDYLATAKELAEYFSEQKNVHIVKCTMLPSKRMPLLDGNLNSGNAFLTLASVNDFDELMSSVEKDSFCFQGRRLRINRSRNARNLAPKDASRVFAFDGKVKVGVFHGENRFLTKWDVNEASSDSHVVHVVINFQARYAKFSFTKNSEKRHVQYHTDDVEEMVNFDLPRRSPTPSIAALLLRTKAAPKLFRETLSSQGSAQRFVWEKVHTDDASGTAQRTIDFSPDQALSSCYDILVEPSDPNHLGRTFLREATGAEYYGLETAWPLTVHSLKPQPPFDIPQDLSFRVRFRIETLFSDGILCKDLLSLDFYKELTKVEEDDALAALAELRQIAEKYDEKQDVYVNNYPLENPLELLQKSTTASRSQTSRRKASKKKPVSDSDFTVDVHRLLVSPLKQYCFGPAADASNRILREYSRLLDHFLRVSFTDEDHNKLIIREGESMQAITDHFRGVLRDGVVVGGRKFEFLGMSCSQMREHSCWFFATANDPETGEEITADSIRKKMGDFSGISVIAKYAARMGQCFSSTISTKKCRLEKNEFEEIPDVEKSVVETVKEMVEEDDDFDYKYGFYFDDDYEVPTIQREVERKVMKNYNFTDGIGTISPEVSPLLFNR